jgi:hypothetical protein
LKPQVRESTGGGDREVVVRVVGGGAGGRGRGGPLSWLSILVLGALGVGVFLLVGLVSGLIDISNPFGTTTIDRSRPVLLKKLTDLSQYTAARGNFETTVDVEDDVGILPSFIAGERTIYFARGSVEANVDFSALARDAVEVRSEDSVTVTLDQPALARASVDPRKSHVAARERGLFDRIGGVFSDNPTSEHRFAVLAQHRIAKAARESNLRDRAERNTTAMLQGFLGRLGYTDVQVVFRAPPSPGERK